MASVKKKSTYNRNSASGKSRRRAAEDSFYVEGNAVRKPLTIEFPAEEKPDSQRTARRRGAAKEEAGLGFGFTVMLALACAAILYMCVGYLQIQADNTATLENISDLEEQLDELATENDDEYNRIISSVDLEEVREKAINELGMVYAEEDQVILYDGSENDYVTQYEDIPEEDSGLSGILESLKTGN